MSTEPLGRGEQPIPKTHNALLTTINTSGNKVTTELWINQFSTGLNIQVDSAQLRTKLSHRPVRFAERYLQFTTIWNVKDRPKYLKLGSTLKEHWAANFNEGQATPMALHYYGANKSFRGFIENWDTAFAITDVVLNYTFNMRLIMGETKKDQMSYLRGKGPYMTQPESYAATAHDITDWGNGWYNKSYWPKAIKDFNKANAKDLENAVTIDLYDGTPYTTSYFKIEGES